MVWMLEIGSIRQAHRQTLSWRCLRLERGENTFSQKSEGLVWVEKYLLIVFVFLHLFLVFWLVIKGVGWSFGLQEIEVVSWEKLWKREKPNHIANSKNSILTISTGSFKEGDESLCFAFPKNFFMVVGRRRRNNFRKDRQMESVCVDRAESRQIRSVQISLVRFGVALTCSFGWPIIFFLWIIFWLSSSVGRGGTCSGRLAQLHH